MMHRPYLMGHGSWPWPGNGQWRTMAKPWSGQAMARSHGKSKDKLLEMFRPCLGHFYCNFMERWVKSSRELFCFDLNLYLFDSSLENPHWFSLIFISFHRFSSRQAGRLGTPADGRLDHIQGLIVGTLGWRNRPREQVRTPPQLKLCLGFFLNIF